MFSIQEEPSFEKGGSLFIWNKSICDCLHHVKNHITQSAQIELNSYLYNVVTAFLSIHSSYTAIATLPVISPFSILTVTGNSRSTAISSYAYRKNSALFHYIV